MSQNQCCSDSSACAHAQTRADTRTRMQESPGRLVKQMMLRVQGPHFEDCWGQGS